MPPLALSYTDLLGSFNIRIDPSPQQSDHSLSEDEEQEQEEDSSGVQVSSPSDLGGHGYQDPYGEWAQLSYPDELKPSDSASRPRASRQGNTHNPTHGSRPASGSGRRNLPRRRVQERESLSRRHRPPSSESLESVDSAEEVQTSYRPWERARGFWPHMTPAHAHSSSPASSQLYPYGGAQSANYLPPNALHPSDQMIRLGHQNQGAAPYGHSLYGYGPHGQYGPSVPPLYMHDQFPGHRAHGHHGVSPFRSERPSSTRQSMPHAVPLHGPSYNGRPTGPHELTPYGPGSYYHAFPESHHVISDMISNTHFDPYPRVPSPTRVGSDAPSKNDPIARLEKLIIEERTEREARETARQTAIEEAEAAKAAKEERAAHEKKIILEAAALAREEAEQKAAEEAAKAKQEAEKAAAEAAAEAAAAATEAANAANKPPPEKKKPIKFKDAVGRKFSFPFDLCCTWQVTLQTLPLMIVRSDLMLAFYPQGMEELIRQAFLHIEVIGPHVAEGHYDLVGPNGDIILPQVWETVIEPDWTITMHMWPIPEKSKTPEPQPGVLSDGPGSLEDDIALLAPGPPKKKSDVGKS